MVFDGSLCLLQIKGRLNDQATAAVNRGEGNVDLGKHMIEGLKTKVAVLFSRALIMGHIERGCLFCIFVKSILCLVFGVSLFLNTRSHLKNRILVQDSVFA